MRVGCDEAVARAAMNGRADAGFAAKTALKYQIQDVKGYMLQEGYHSIAVTSQRVDCRPYPLAVGLTLCVATARLCSR